MQYGIRLRTESRGIPWDEFCSYLTGIDSDTPLGKIVSIRAETNRDTIKRFGKYEREIRSKWRKFISSKTAQVMDKNDWDANISILQNSLRKMFGKGAAK